MYNPFARIVNRLLDVFNDAAKVTKSHIPTINTPARIHVPEEHEKMDNNVSCLKRSRLIRSKDTSPHKKWKRNQEFTFLNSEQTRNETTPEVVETYEKVIDPENNEIFINNCNNL